MIKDYEIFKQKRDKALKDKNFNDLYDAAIESAVFFMTKNSVLEAAFFIGRTRNIYAFNELLGTVQKASVCSSPFDNQFVSFDKEQMFYNLGYKYPWLTDDELDFLESLYQRSDTYSMINRMLFDKELLRRDLKHFDPNLYDKKNDFFSSSLCSTVFKAFLRNEVELNVEEALEERLQSFEDKFLVGSILGFEPDSNYPPIYVYNRLDNCVILDTTTQINDIFLFPIHRLGKLSRAVDLFCQIFFDERDLKQTLSEVLQTKAMVHHIDSAILCGQWYLILERYICRRFSISNKSDQICKVRNTLAKEWLEGINNKNLR